MFWNTARKAFVLGLLLPLIAVPSGAIAQGNSRDAVSPEFRAWVDARAGTGQPVHWVAEGGVYEYPSGRKLFGMVGFDSSRVIWPGRPGDPVIHLTRKTFAYTDPQTGEVLREYNGQPVTPVAYPYQMITYRQDGAQIFADVEQGAGGRAFDPRAGGPVHPDRQRCEPPGGNQHRQRLPRPQGQRGPGAGGL